ncbi:hypothetical protein O181_006673 [Austropuccinia psidii MF-1]|uniref:Timeless N-terminal domain-containing protein n=1 Tax=Austropuccinia psidii MF-1 TaxID=1389203 RepID=A0A9Q3GGT6_9BASI|nr:hypothetical protein [Austropuccinia psidii MF-1]
MAPKQAEVKLKVALVDTERNERRKALEPVVLNVVSALGGYEDVLVNPPRDNDDGPTTTRVYQLGDECIGCLKDLKKFWRLDEDDDNRTVARILYFSQVLPNDLLPILMSIQIGQKKDDRVALLCSDLIAALTWPIDIASEVQEAYEIQDEESRRQAISLDLSGLVSAQLSYKRDIVRSGALGYIFRLILPIIQKGKNERTGKDDNVISLFLHIIRNLVALRDKVSNHGSESVVKESHLQSELIVQMSELGIFDLLVHMCHGSDRFDLYGQWNMIVLDIWHLLLRGVDAEELIDAEPFCGINAAGETLTTMTSSSKKLENLLLAEQQARKAKARKGATRHSRFGTTLTVKAGEKKFHLHNQSAITTPVEVALDARKKQKNKTPRLVNEFGRPTVLKLAALKVLRKAVIEVLESGFNPFFSSVLKDIRMERAHIKEADTIRFLSLMAFFLNAFLLLREREKEVGVLHNTETGHDFDLIAELLDPECILWVILKIKNGIENRPMPVVEIHAGIECFLQQLLVTNGLLDSSVEEYKQVANVILNKIYYNSDTLDMVINLMSTYTDQSLKYLKNIVHFSFVFLRILERYAQSKDYMYVRKKKPKKASRPTSDSENPQTEEAVVNATIEEEEQALRIEEDNNQFAEHKFEFGRFQMRFAREAIVDTLVTYIRGYQNFTDPELMKWAVKLMYRQAVNAKAEKLFFKVSVLNTFSSMIDEKESMPKHPVYTDLFRFIDYILKQYFKCVRTNPFMLVEVLFNKSITEWNRLLDDSSSDDSDSTRPVLKPQKLPAEILVKPGLTWSQKLGVAVGLLVDGGKSGLIHKIQDTLRTASASRTAVVLMTDGPIDDEARLDFEAWLNHPLEEPSENLKAQLKLPSPTALEKFEDYRVEANQDAGFEQALFRDAELHLLLRLLHWDSQEEHPGYLRWTIPKTRTHTELDLDIKIVDYFLLNPLDHNGKGAAELTTKKRKTQRRVRLSRKTEESSEKEKTFDGTADDQMTVKKSKPRRRARLSRKTEEAPQEDKTLDDGDASDQSQAQKASSKAKKKMEIQKYLSAQFITESDDEENEERDRLFFEKERKLRAQILDEFSKGVVPSSNQASLPSGQEVSHDAISTHLLDDDGPRDKDAMEVDAQSPRLDAEDESQALSSSPNDSEEMQQSKTSSHSSPNSMPLSESYEVNSRKRELERTSLTVGRGKTFEKRDDDESIATVKRVKTMKLLINDSDEE